MPIRRSASAPDYPRETVGVSTNAPPGTPSRQNGMRALLGAIACTVFGAKLITISALGSPTPLLDQWDAEAANLYAPYVKGTLSFADLFAPHLEHRIFLTRVLALVHLELAGEWNTRLEMILDAIVHTTLITWLAALLMPLVAPQRRMLLGCFVAFLFVFPIGYENTLWGFQSQVYFTLLFGVAALVAFASARAFSWRWFGGLTAAVLSYLSYSSGVATIVAAGALVGLQLATNARRRCDREFAAVVVLSSVAIAMILWVASSASPAMTPLAVIQGFLLLAALTVVGAIPTVWFCQRTLVSRPPISDRAWVVVGIAAWIAIQLGLLAYGRGTLIAVRYMDIVLLVYPVALVGVFALADRASATRLGRYAGPGAAAWLFAVVVAIGVVGYYETAIAAVGWSNSARQQMVNAKAYLSTANVAHLQVTGAHGYTADLSYPNPQRLAKVLEDPDVRAILPPDLRPAGADNAGARRHIWSRGALAGTSGAAVDLILGSGPAFLALALGLFFAAGARRSGASLPV